MGLGLQIISKNKFEWSANYSHSLIGQFGVAVSNGLEMDGEGIYS
jgi:hypothetical protein